MKSRRCDSSCAFNVISPSLDSGSQTAQSGDVSFMSYFSRRSLLLGSANLLALPKLDPEQHYLFATDEYDIRMILEYHDNEPNRVSRF